MKRKDFYSLLKAVPKAELHLHGEATVSNRTIKKLFRHRYGRTLQDSELKALFSYDDLGGFLKSFLKIQGFFSSLNDLVWVFSDFENYLKKNNIVYCETFFSPTSLKRNGFAFHDLIEHISKAIASTQRRTGAVVRILVDVSRSFGLENAEENLNLILKENNSNIIGIGLGGDEAKGPAKDYAPVFEKAAQNGLHRVVHAGETCDSWSIKDSINLCKAERIGHGISAAYDENFIKDLAKSSVALEVCPTSNLYTRHYVSRIKDHPFKKLYDAGILVTLNTDDPTFFKVSLIDEYWNVYTKLGVSLKDIKEIIKNAFRASFLPQEKKDSYCASVDKAWSEWFSTHPTVAEE